MAKRIKNPIEVPHKKIKHVYVNWRKLVKDTKKKYPDRRVTAPKIAAFMYEDDRSSLTTKRKRWNVKASEHHTTSEFTITEFVNLCDYTGLTMDEFIADYTHIDKL